YTRTDGSAGVADTTGTSIDSLAFPGAKVYGLSSGGDGFVWVASSGDSRLWGIRYDAVAASFYWRTISVHGAPLQLAWCQQKGGLYWLAYAPDPVVGFAQYGTAINEYQLTGAGSNPHAIACAADGDAWFTEIGNSAIVRYSDGMSFST